MKMINLKCCGNSEFNIYHKVFGVIRVQDIHVGYGGNIIKPLKFNKGDALKFLRVLNLCKINLTKSIDWKLMDRISNKIKIKYSY